MRTVAIIFASIVMGSSPAHAQLGRLPADPVLTRSIDSVVVELSLRFWVDPALVEGKTPDGISLTRVRSYGIPDSIISREYQDWIDASLVVTSAGSITINDVPLAPGTDDNNEAFWWLQIEDAATGGDSRILGNQQSVELEYWIADSAAVARIRSSGGLAHYGLSSTSREAGGWRFVFDVGDSRVEGRCRLTGDVVTEAYKLPAFSTVWHAGPEPTRFTVYTYQGHRSQRCGVESLTVTGDGLLAIAIRRSVEIQDASVVAMTGWEARAATYVHPR